jgi:voltage-gated potassium channel
MVRGQAGTLAMSPELKTRIYGILEPGGEDSRYFDPFILGLIVLNVGAVVLETVDSIYNSYALLFNAFEIFSVALQPGIPLADLVLH